MYIYMGMFFNSPQDVPDFGSITMYFVGTKELGYVEEGHKRFRKYAFQSTDLNKLSLITNALDGSEAFAVDTGITYVLYNGQWSIKSSELAPAKMEEILEDITSIDYQVVTVLPDTGIKGTIYLVNHSHGENDIYDEYIWINGAYEKIGNTDIDLRNYIQKVLNANNKVPKFDSNGNLVSTGYELNKTVPADAVFSDTQVTQNIAPVTGTFDLLMAKTSGNHSAETDNVNKSGSNLTFNVANKQLTIDGNKALTEADLVVCTQDEYDAMQTKPGLLYFIKEEST